MTLETRMDSAAIFARIRTLAESQGLSLRGLSLDAGLSADFLRSWQRRIESGGSSSSISARNLEAIAAQLRVTVSDLTGDSGPPAAMPPRAGFSEAAAEPFRMPPAANDDEPDLLRALFPGAGTPAAYRLTSALPQFSQLAGDILVVDMARLPAPGEICLVSTFDDDQATATTTVRRYLPPFLVSGSADASATFLRVDSPGVTVRYPVIGGLRGVSSA
jgi:transcriptional regulator with XRE-family HTH domain